MFCLMQMFDLMWHKYDFQGVGWSLVESGGQKIAWVASLGGLVPPDASCDGSIMGVSGTPHDAPHIIFF